MKQTRTPFGQARRGPDVVWPMYTGPTNEPRSRREPELWERDVELFVGETVLADLVPGRSPTEALLILGRYETTRAVSLSARLQVEPFSAEIEAAAARDYLDAIPHQPERRWLRAALESLGPGGEPSPGTVATLSAAAAAASRLGHAHGAFALHAAAYRIAHLRSWHRAAARVARAVARTAAAGKGERSRRRWARRARVHELRAGT